MDCRGYMFESLLTFMKGEREDIKGDFNLRVGTEGNQGNMHEEINNFKNEKG